MFTVVEVANLPRLRAAKAVAAAVPVAVPAAAPAAAAVPYLLLPAAASIAFRHAFGRTGSAFFGVIMLA